MKLKTLRILLFMFSALCCFSLTAPAAVFTVNDSRDSNDLNTGDGICADSLGSCTLRAATQESNALTGSDTINCLFVAPTSVTLMLGEIAITDSLVINGGNADNLIISGNSSGRIFSVLRSNVSVLIRGLTLANGRTNGDGGGIYVDSANLTLENVVVRNNISGSNGGGVYSGYNGVFRFINSTARNNIAQNNGGGGGLSIRGNGSEISGSRILNNDARRGGGGIEVTGAIVNISNTTVSDNTSNGGGGGLLAVFGTARISGSTFSNNTTLRSGGGIALPYGSVTLTNSTVSGNRVTNGEGGGISTGTNGTNGNLTVRNSTLVLNSANYAGGLSGSGSIIGNSIVANNVAQTAPNIGAEFTSLGGNLVNNRSGGLGYITTDLPDGTQPLIGALADNGGPTQTHALLDGSEAINSGIDSVAVDADGNSLTTDQRGLGFPRFVGITVDIGSFEIHSGPDSINVKGKFMATTRRGTIAVFVKLTDLTTNESVTASINPLGHFNFINVRKNRMYRIEAVRKTFTVADQTMMIDNPKTEIVLVEQ